MTQEQTTFNVDAWRRQGEDALAKLEREYGEMAEALEDKDAEIKKLQEALGVKDEPEKRPRIRPIVVEKLLETRGQPVSVDDLVDLVQGELPKASFQSIRISIQRLVAVNDKVKFVDDGAAVTHE